MKALSYYLVLPIIYALSAMPFWLMYLFSDGCYFLIYHVIGYRKKIARMNLRNAFSEKTDADLLKIEKAHYHYFCDLVFETLKTLTYSTKSLAKRIDTKGFEDMRRLQDKGQSVVVAMGHFGNWEMVGAAYNKLGLHHINVIYHPLSNKYFNRLVCHMRERHGTGLYPMKQVAELLERDKDKVTATVFISDQSPKPEKAYWTTFMNQDTPVFFGIEKFAKEFNYPVVYLSIPRRKRGHYTMEFEVLIEDPSQVGQYEITEAHVRRLEKDIRKQPEIWLWTHHRWKHKRPDHTA